MKACLLAVLMLLLCATSHAQPMMPGGMPPPGGARGARGDNDQIKQLQAQLSEEQKRLDDIEEELRSDFEKKPEWQDAQAAQEQAQADHEAARNAVLTTVHETPEYKSALERKFAAESALQNLNATGDVPAEELMTAQNELMQAVTEARKMEDDALAADPAVSDTKQKLTDANARLNDLKKQFRDSLSLNPGWLEQSDVVEDLKFKLTEARQRVADANRQRSQSNRPRESSKPRRSGGGGGRPPGMR